MSWKKNEFQWEYSFMRRSYARNSWILSSTMGCLSLFRSIFLMWNANSDYIFLRILVVRALTKCKMLVCRNGHVFSSRVASMCTAKIWDECTIKLVLATIEEWNIRDIAYLRCTYRKYVCHARRNVKLKVDFQWWGQTGTGLQSTSTISYSAQVESHLIILKL